MLNMNFSLYEEGIRGVFLRIYYKLWFNLARVDFSREELPDHIDNIEHGSEARPMVSTSVAQIYALVSKAKLSDPDTLNGSFVDLGCGKGRALFGASEAGFRRVFGVEFVPEFCVVARSNMRKLNATNIEILNGDATLFEFPSDLKFLYLFNPFGKEVMRKVCYNLKNKVKGSYFIGYDFPQCRDVIESELEAQIIFENAKGNILLFKVNGSCD